MYLLTMYKGYARKHLQLKKENLHIFFTNCSLKTYLCVIPKIKKLAVHPQRKYT